MKSFKYANKVKDSQDYLNAEIIFVNFKKLIQGNIKTTFENLKRFDKNSPCIEPTNSCFNFKPVQKKRYILIILSFRKPQRISLRNSKSGDSGRNMVHMKKLENWIEGKSLTKARLKSHQ